MLIPSETTVDESDVLRWPPARLQIDQDDRLRATVALCYEHHPYYGDLMRRLGLEPADIQDTGDLCKLPLTTKSDFLEAPEAFRLDLPTSLGESALLWDVMYTTGSTTGKPAAVYTTAADHHAYIFQAKREGNFIGLSSADTIANLLPLTAFPMGAYVRSASDAAAVGAAMLWCHTGRAVGAEGIHRSLDEAIDLVVGHRASVLWGIASFVRRFLLRCEERRVDLTSVRMCLVTGEAVPEPMRRALGALMKQNGCSGSQVVSRYGATELGTSLYDCAPDSGLHLLAPESIYLEVVNPEDHHPLPEGEVGLLALSHLDRRGTVLLRYALGDLTALSREACPSCGRKTPRLVQPPRRTAGIVKVKGTLVDANSLYESLAHLPDVRELQLVLTREDPRDELSTDQLIVRVSADHLRQQDLEQSVISKVRSLARVSPVVTFVTDDSLFDPLGGPKPRRIVDLRSTS
jgi:phenylacetate-CoA ligase